MKKNIFAVCDLEVEYAFNFMDYLNQKRNLPFEIQVFPTAESLAVSYTHLDVYKRQVQQNLHTNIRKEHYFVHPITENI